MNVTVVRGYTMVAGVRPTVADWNAGFLPSVTITGSVEAGDLADYSVGFDTLATDLILDGTVTTAINLVDKLLYGDVSDNGNRVITFSNVLISVGTVATAVTAFTNLTTDQFLYWDAATGLPQKMGIARFLEQGLTQAPSLATTATGDSVLVLDADGTDGAQAKAVTLANLLPDVVAATTVANPTSITVNAKGQVTAVTGTAGGTDSAAFLRDTGASGTSPLSVSSGVVTEVRLTDTTTVSWLSLATNSFTLSAGTYEIDAVVPYYAASAANTAYALFVYDETAAATVLTSTGQISSDEDYLILPLKGIFTIATAHTLSLRVQIAINCTLGRASSLGYAETYAQVLLRKLAT